MEVKFLAKFNKDLDNIDTPNIKSKLIDFIKEVELSEKLSEISNLKKLTGFRNAFRIKFGDYRIGLFLENGIIEFARIVHRKDIYKVFP